MKANSTTAKTMPVPKRLPPISGLHHCPVTIARNGFKHKSLSCWALNPCMGCTHGCPFCFVPDTSTRRQKKLLATYGVNDPIAEWGRYLLVRPWHEKAFMASLKKAQGTPLSELNADGNRAVMFSTTTDPYLVVRNSDPEKQRILHQLSRRNMCLALERILEHSDLNVRILTRSPLAREDFDLFQRFGNRLLFGVSLPTLDDVHARLYEPHAPGPTKRLELLMDAHAAGISTFVAIAPVFPECSFDDMLDVFKAVKKAEPVTYYMEPVNIRIGIAERILAEAKRIHRHIDIAPYKDKAAWARYAIGSLRDAERAADLAGVRDRLHLWPDHDDLGAARVVKAQAKVWDHPSGMTYEQWLRSYWHRVSEWPGKASN